MGLSPEIETAIMKAAAKYGVEKALIKAVMKRESDFRPKVSREEPHINDASIGLMQVLVKTARWMANDESIDRQRLFDIQFNVDVGTKYIRYQLDRYSDMKKAIAAYNAGSAKYKSDGSFINQPYVDYVYGWYLKYLDEESAVFGPMPLLSPPSSVPGELPELQFEIPNIEDSSMSMMALAAVVALGAVFMMRK